MNDIRLSDDEKRILLVLNALAIGKRMQSSELQAASTVTGGYAFYNATEALMKKSLVVRPYKRGGWYISELGRAWLAANE